MDSFYKVVRWVALLAVALTLYVMLRVESAHCGTNFLEGFISGNYYHEPSCLVVNIEYGMDCIG